MGAPLVSVGIITYNHEKYIRQCLEGVMMQKTNFPFEVIIGEDCSTDNTRSIIQEFEAKYPGIIKPIYHEKNVGGARNAYEFCYAHVKGKYIAMCEGDDYWTDPYKLQKQVDFLEQNPDCVMCFHHVNRVNQYDEILERQKPADKVTYHNWKDLFRLNIDTLSIVFRNVNIAIPKEIIEARCADAFLKGMMASQGNAANLGFVGAHYRKHPAGVYSSKTVLEQFQNSMQTRRLMKNSAFFNDEQRRIIKKLFFRRKALYMIYFLKKRELLNCLKIAFT